VKTLQKRLDTAALSIADLLNTHLFGHNGPTGDLCATLGVSKGPGTKVLRKFMPENYTGLAFPRKETDCQVIPASQEAQPHLVMALGLLCRFNAERNSAVPTQYPQCSFDNLPILQGIQRLEQHGPLSFEVIYAASAGLGGLFQSNICGAIDPNGVGLAMGTKLTM
jgi:hypothetical protein